MKNRSELWNGVEAFESRKNSQLAREFEVSVPYELSPEQRQDAVRRFVDKELVARGMVADVSYHEFTGRKAHNPHAHILVTMREIDGNTFSRKKNRDWNKQEILVHWREAWARHANQVLKEAHLNTRIDHRSYEDRGITLTPLNESRGAWRIRQWEVQEACKDLVAVETQLAALEKEQKQQQERIDAVIQFGNELACRRTQRKEQQAERERQHQERHQAQQDERRLIEQWQEYKDRERGKPRVTDQQLDQAKDPARGESLEQQVAKLKESMAAFDAELEKLNHAEKQPRQSEPCTRRSNLDQQPNHETKHREPER